jgi:hypothetical protein
LATGAGRPIQESVLRTEAKMSDYEYKQQNMVSKWFKNFFDPEKTVMEEWVEKLPPLGDSILRLLIEAYGPLRVAKAARVFVDLEDRKKILKQSKEEIERILGALK